MTLASWWPPGRPRWACGGAGADLLEGVHHVHPFSPSRSPGPLHPAAEFRQGRGRPPVEVGGSLGGGGSSSRSWTRTGCEGNGKFGGAWGGGSWTWDGAGGRRGVRRSGSGGGGGWG